MPADPNLRFCGFEANLTTGELWKDGAKIKLQEQPFRLLAMLLRKPGEIVTREELQEALWKEVEYGEFEQGLNTAVKKVRQALGDSADTPTFVETIPRKGYRFIAPIDSSKPKRKLWPLGAALVAAAVAVWALLPEKPTRYADPAPLTTLRGSEVEPNFSPDGRQIAFSWNGEREDNYDIYSRPLDSEKLTRLTTDSRTDFAPAFSPDGRRVAFARMLTELRVGIFLVPAGGGPEALLTETARGWARGWTTVHPFFSWSPDGKWLAISDVSPSDPSRLCLFLLSVDTGERRVLTNVTVARSLDMAPAFASDGRSIAFLRMQASWASNPMRLALTADLRPSGEPVDVEKAPDGRTYGIAWLDKEKHLLLAKSSNGLWTDSGTHIPGATKMGESAAVSSAGDIAFAVAHSDANIWAMALGPPGQPKPLIASTRIDMVPQFSQDGRHIVFVSDRGGQFEVWTAEADGSNPRQVTTIGSAGSPSWSPDGSHIVFDSTASGQYDIYTISAAGGTPRRLTDHPGTDGVATYSRDGKHIYWSSRRGGNNQIWRMNTDGTGAVQITKDRGQMPFESMDRKHLYYFKSKAVWRVPAEGGEEVEILPGVGGFLDFAIARAGIYYVPEQGIPGARGQREIRYFDLATKASRKIVDIGAGTLPGRVAVSPDGQTLIWSQTDVRGSDLMLLKRLP